MTGPAAALDIAAAEHAPLASALHLAIAGLVGLAVGLEREWSGHASGPRARFAGIRTFFLLGLLGGTAGLLLWLGFAAAGAALLGMGALFVAVAYVMAVRRAEAELDGTTEGAALVVLGLGALAGVGELGLAGGATPLVVLALGEKERLHGLVHRIGERELRAALEFAVLALVVLPLLPVGPYGPLGGVRPRALWGIVVLLSGLNFAGYLARRAIGPDRGYGLTGLLGGLVSSTAVTLQFARTSREVPRFGASLALGVIAASTVLIPRVTLVSAVLNPAVAVALLPYVIPPLLVGAALVLLALRRRDPAGEPVPDEATPLRLASAIQMAVLFQAAMMAVTAVRHLWGDSGVLASAVLLGLTDLDALTVSMSRVAQSGDGVALAAQAIGVGLLSNTIVKLALAATVGTGRFARATAGGLGALAVAVAVGLWLGGRA